MADLHGFDARNVDPATTFEAIPAGKYIAAITMPMPATTAYQGPRVEPHAPGSPAAVHDASDWNAPIKQRTSDGNPLRPGRPTEAIVKKTIKVAQIGILEASPATCRSTGRRSRRFRSRSILGTARCGTCSIASIVSDWGTRRSSSIRIWIRRSCAGSRTNHVRPSPRRWGTSASIGPRRSVSSAPHTAFTSKSTATARMEWSPPRTRALGSASTRPEPPAGTRPRCNYIGCAAY